MNNNDIGLRKLYDTCGFNVLVACTVSLVHTAVRFVGNEMIPRFTCFSDNITYSGTCPATITDVFVNTMRDAKNVTLDGIFGLHTSVTVLAACSDALIESGCDAVERVCNIRLGRLPRECFKVCAASSLFSITGLPMAGQAMQYVSYRGFSAGLTITERLHES